ncbi:unnamed protein product [Ambrosiozyma monospora]|uniref:Unnamed protein product n=1 Tax=Ambrosiozyma monospora TaxID=43982 RepID=A0A9W6YWC2_AMBMO|nr:unnamed protein product [Ambrosiozyma monospora]
MLLIQTFPVKNKNKNKNKLRQTKSKTIKNNNKKQGNSVTVPASNILHNDHLPQRQRQHSFSSSKESSLHSSNSPAPYHPQIFNSKPFQQTTQLLTHPTYEKNNRSIDSLESLDSQDPLKVTDSVHSYVGAGIDIGDGEKNNEVGKSHVSPNIDTTTLIEDNNNISNNVNKNKFTAFPKKNHVVKTTSSTSLPARVRTRASTLTSWFQRQNSLETQNGNGNTNVNANGKHRRSDNRRLSYASVLGRRNSGFDSFHFPGAYGVARQGSLNGVSYGGVDPDDDDLISLLLNSDVSDDDEDEDDFISGDGVSSLKTTGQEGDPLSKRETLKKEVTKRLEKIGFFDPKFERIKVILKFLRGYGFLISMLMGIFGLFWGSFYQRESRLVNLNCLVLLDDPQTYSSLPIDDYFSDVLKESVLNSNVSRLAGWKIEYYQDFITSNGGNEADPYSMSASLDSILQKKVHHDHYWCVVYVTPNSSLDYYNAIQSSNGSSSFNNNEVYHAIYETGRNYAGVGSYVVKALSTLQKVIQSYQTTNITIPLIQSISESQVSTPITKLLLSPIMVSQHDLTDSELLKAISIGPQQFGLVYLHLLSLMQFSFFQPFHLKVATKLTNRSFVLYRLISSQITYLTIGLAYTLVQIAFKIDIYSAYPGKTGFVVFWVFTYLMLSALGGVNENVLLLIQTLMPNIIPVFQFFWMVVNIAPTYYPLEISPGFYKYAYCIPIFNGYEVYRILLFNTWKNASLARNVCVLLSWVVVTNMLLPLTMKFYTKKKNEQSLGKVQEIKRLKKLRKRAKMLSGRATDLITRNTTRVTRRSDNDGTIASKIDINSKSSSTNNSETMDSTGDDKKP